MTTPSARPPLRFLLVVRIACEITGVGVYPSCASIMVVTPLAANTSSALANAGIDSAWVSIPMNSGPVMRAPCRCSQIAWLMARMCASLKALLKAEPRCPEVPKATRCDGTAGSGRPEKYAVTNRGTLTSMDAGAVLPASGLTSAAISLSANGSGCISSAPQVPNHPSTTLIRWVAPSSASGNSVRSPVSALPSSSASTTPRLTPRGFSTRMS